LLSESESCRDPHFLYYPVQRVRDVGHVLLYLRSTSGGGKEATMRTGTRFADATTDLPALMDMDRARELLGMSRSAVYRAAAAGHLPTLHFGRRVYVPTARLLAMLGIDAEEEP
jgi:hypothetical protein